MNYMLNTDNRAWAEDVFEKTRRKLEAECSRMEGIIPYIARNGRYHDLDSPEGISWWTNGFWPGLLWQMYHATKNEGFRKTAEAVEARLNEALEGWEGLHHDVGFMWLHSAVANYRLTGNRDSRRQGLHAANLLAGRYNPAGRFIRAWNDDHTGDRAGWIIIDCLMNIPLLFWASEELRDPRFAYIAQDHADTALNVLARPDGSCNHIAVLSPESGECLETPGGQGYAPGSSWSRGHAWAVYGFALSFRHTGQERYLDAAKKTAHYVISNFALNDWLPLVDFRAPVKPVKRDSTAAMITACGLLEIAGHVGEYEKPFYTAAALNVLRAGERAFADWDTETDGIIGKGTGSYHGGPEDTEVPLIYGDYFFVEAILRLLEKDFFIW
jgi:unsaturated chondroitin disaccharide hydrolase